MASNAFRTASILRRAQLRLPPGARDARSWPTPNGAVLLISPADRLQPRAMTSASPRIAVLLPCYNEEAAIAATVAGLSRRAAGRDDLRLRQQQQRRHARRRGARRARSVRTERQQGKGHVVRRMFADIDADVYVMADGDLTYDPDRGAGDGRPARSPSSSTWSSAPADTSETRPIAAVTSLATSSSPGFFRACSGAASPTFSRATGCFRGASSKAFRCSRRGSRSRPR